MFWAQKEAGERKVRIGVRHVRDALPAALCACVCAPPTCSVSSFRPALFTFLATQIRYPENREF